jgi:hypothetical protein
MKYLIITLASLGLLVATIIPHNAEAGLRDNKRDRIRSTDRRVKTPEREDRLNPRGVADPRGENDPRSDNMDENRDARQDTAEKNSENREDARGEGDDEREDAFEENQDNRQDTHDDASENREQGREEYADEVFDDGNEFRGDEDGLIDGDGFESDDNDLLKVMTIGAMSRSLPQNAQPQSVNGSDYYSDGTNWYKPVSTASGMTYEVVPAPSN